MIIPFERNYREKYYKLLEEVFESGFLSEGKMLKKFESDFSKITGLQAMAVTNGGAALQIMYEYVGVRGKDVVVPANTFWATAAAAKRAGANLIYADCNKEDLCMSLDDLKKKVTKNTKAVCITHIGGHIAFQIEEIAAFCKERDIVLIEDCAHAHGAEYKGKTGGSWGLGGAYSFYATKTLPLGEGGMVVSNNKEFTEWLKYYRNYGKKVADGKVSYEIKDGFNFRINEVTAAFGVVQLERLPMILEWKNKVAAKFDKIFENRVKFPAGMKSGYYKYIVFDYKLNEETGKVFNFTDFGNEIEGVKADIPNSYWIAEHHRCAPIWFGWSNDNLDIESMRKLLLG